MSSLGVIALVVVGGAAGSMLRGWLAERFAGALPWTILFINVTGSFVAGWLNAHFTGQPEKIWVLTFLVTGVCGGYTTFSSFAFQLLGQWRSRHTRLMVLYLVLTLTLGIAAAWAGLKAGN
jgi:CrcB protein